MPYTDNTTLKTYLGITGSGDDALLTALIARAQAAIEQHTHRVFEASADTTRYFDAWRDTDGFLLTFDEDICAITSVTNGDGTTVTSGQYVTEPRNRTPYYAIRLRSTNGMVDWVENATNGPENAIAVEGKWAYSTTPPADIVHATVRLAAFYYRQKDAQVFDVAAIPGAGVIQLPQGVPADVQNILRPYVKQF